MSRERSGIIASERQLPDEDLTLVGFGCNDRNCDWELPKEKAEYHKALEEYGKHNIQVHGGRIEYHMTNLYISKTSPNPKTRSWHRT